MHHFYTLLALDLANERAREAQWLHDSRRLVEHSRRRSIRRRLTDAARGVLSMIDDALPTGEHEQPRLPAGHSH